jgi:cation diffusion facilitator family transporter
MILHGQGSVMEESHGHVAAGDEALATNRGIRALKISIAGLMLTALLQGGIALAGGSAGLLADTIHNVADIAPAIPLWIAFNLARRQPNRRFTYGYGRAEDMAGVVTLLLIVGSAVLSAVESLDHLVANRTPTLIELSLLAALAGVAGNELVARYKIKIGKEIGSAALVADGQHSRADGLTSLAAFIGLLGVQLGFPQADPLAGLFITLFILALAWEVGRDILSRLMDAVDPQVVTHMEALVLEHPQVRTVNNIRARWIGHALTMELAIGVDGALSLAAAHAIAEKVRHDLLAHIPRLSNVVVHVDPIESYPGEYHLEGSSDP